MDGERTTRPGATERPGVDVRRELPVHLTWMIGLVLAFFSLTEALRVRPGMDSHAFWAAWRGSMYDAAPNTVDAYNYSPAFAQAIWPLAGPLPWPVFGVLWSLLCVAGLVWLLRPLGLRWGAPLLLCCTPEILSGNVFWLLGVVAVLGLRPGAGWAALWVLPLLTKITPALGPVWFAARGEWRRVAVSAAATLAVAALSWGVAPDLWREWLDFLRANSGGAAERSGSSWFPPLLVRLPAALALVAWGARGGRVWTLPAAMVLATPVTGVAAFTMLAAIPRLRLSGSAGGSAPRTAPPAPRPR